MVSASMWGGSGGECQLKRKKRMGSGFTIARCCAPAARAWKPVPTFLNSSCPKGLIGEAVGLRDCSYVHLAGDEVASGLQSFTVHFHELFALHRFVQHGFGSVEREALGGFEDRAEHHDVGDFGGAGLVGDLRAKNADELGLWRGEVRRQRVAIVEDGPS